MVTGETAWQLTLDLRGRATARQVRQLFDALNAHDHHGGVRPVTVAVDVGGTAACSAMAQAMLLAAAHTVEGLGGRFVLVDVGHDFLRDHP